MYHIITPKTEAEFEKYYDFRWQVLKQPFGFAQGSEKDEYDSLAQHRMICREDGKVLAVGRIHFVSQEEAQIRHIAVCDQCRGKGLASMLMTTLEQAAREHSIQRVITFSKLDTIGFFEKCGYEVLDNPIIDIAKGTSGQRKQMCKKLSEYDVILRQPFWCKELQETWHNLIPITQQMGIKIFQYTGAFLEVRAVLNANINMHQTMFAGSVYSMATLAGWGMVHLLMRENTLHGDIVLGKGEIKYNKPITKLPRAIVSINSVEGELSVLANNKKANLKLTVEIFDQFNKVGEFYGHYFILPAK
ncbi:bifunctional GNAT family N-acetyltransferase/thioesterase [Catenovulum sp. 2E275]|uniref:bifunctional GNAT family N-acetyltransferase/hotdog fold thioesterase n=1 Tax=Catenovulum sp. 2E275 TaxID=2980497 RepID=UPI0021D3C91D|nr:bifunctional GNAT family N-acetyltransferase/thioesterase [Catenovulum sp. 2E275]MCU4675857.1 bifunctional GNAT family N-acetyltransferase/thioesterase [Catenovulum sp. 2E275]